MLTDDVMRCMDAIDDELLVRARDAIARRTLPAKPPERTWGGPGNGSPCPVCGHPLDVAEMVFDLEFADLPSAGSVFQQIHVRCFKAWELERGASQPRRARAGELDTGDLRE